MLYDCVTEFFNKILEEFQTPNSTTENLNQTHVVNMWLLTTGLYIVGGVAGAIITSLTADRINRKRSIFVSNIFTVIEVKI